MSVRSLAVSWLAIALMSPAAAGDWQERVVRMEAHQDYSSETCIELDAGQTLELRLAAPYAVDFNIHHHTRTDTLYTVRERIEGEASYSVTMDTRSEYCLMWTNPATRSEAFAITAEIRVR